MRPVASGRRVPLVVKEESVSDVHVTYDRSASLAGDVECVECPLEFIALMKWPQAADHLEVHAEHGHTVRDSDLATAHSMANSYKSEHGRH